MKVFLIKLNYIFITIIIFLKYTSINPQIYDNFNKGVLEEGDYDLIDITDYQKLNILVTTSKNIYKGIPPTKQSMTEAKLFNSSSIITLNDDYLLAACLQDSLLTKIKISSGEYSNLLSY